MAVGGFCHGGCRHIGRNVHQRTRNGGRQRLQLPADGARIHRGLLGDSVCACAALLQAQLVVDLRLSRRAFRFIDLPYRGMVLLRFKNAWRGGEVFCRVHSASDPCVRPSRYSVCGQCRRHHRHCVALHFSRRCQDPDMDRYSQEFLPYNVGGAVYMVHSAEPRPVVGRCRRFDWPTRLVAHLLLRRSVTRRLLLEAVSCRSVHGHRHKRP